MVKGLARYVERGSDVVFRTGQLSAWKMVDRKRVFRLDPVQRVGLVVQTHRADCQLTAIWAMLAVWADL